MPKIEVKQNKQKQQPSFLIDDFQILDNFTENPLDNFMYPLREKETIRQYPKRLKIFLDCGLDSSLTLEDQSKIFYSKAKDNPKWRFT